MHLGSWRYPLLAILICFSFAACPDCDDLGDTLPQAVLEPPVLDLGPVSEGTLCEAEILVSNKGGSTLSIDEASLEDKNGDFEITRVAEQVGIRSEEPILIDYTSSAPLNERQSATLSLITNDPDEEGVVRATITAIPVESTAGIAVAWCEMTVEDESGESSDELKMCSSLEFGAVNIGDATVPVTERSGLTREVVIINEGTDELGIDLIGE